MKKILTAFMLSVVFVSCNNEQPKGDNGETYKSATEYNDYIVSRQTILKKDKLDIEKIADFDLDSAGKMLDNYVMKTSTMVQEIKSMPPYKGDSTFRDAAAGIFGSYNKIFGEDYRVILHLLSEQDGTSTEIEERINQLNKKVEGEEKNLDNQFQNAQKTFAQKHNLKPGEN
jgi:hypothetical protein